MAASHPQQQDAPLVQQQEQQQQQELAEAAFAASYDETQHVKRTLRRLDTTRFFETELHWRPWASSRASTTPTTTTASSSGLRAWEMAEGDGGDYAIVAQIAVQGTLGELRKLFAHGAGDDACSAFLKALFRSQCRRGRELYRDLSADQPAPNITISRGIKSCLFNRTSLRDSDQEFVHVAELDDAASISDNTRLVLYTMVAIPPADRPAAWSTCASAGPKRLSVGYLMRPDPDDTKNRAAVLLYGCQTGPSDATTIMRLRKMADALKQLDNVVLRRRLGFQVVLDTHRKVLINHRATGRKYIFTAPPPPPHCNRCADGAAGHPNTRVCAICGLVACGDCARYREIERQVGQVSFAWLCQCCVDLVNGCEFDDPGDARRVAQERPRVVPVRKLPPHAQYSAAKRLARMLNNCGSNRLKQQAIIGMILSLSAKYPMAVAAQQAQSSELARRFDPTEDPRVLEQHIHALLADADVAPVAACDLIEDDFHKEYGLEFIPGTQLPRYPLPDDEAERIEATVRAIEPSDSIRVIFTGICEVAASELQCAVSLVSYSDDADVVFCGGVGWGARRVPRATSLCSYTILSQKPFLVPNLVRDVRFRYLDNVAVHGLRFYFAFPLVSHDGIVFGSLCVADATPRTSISTRDYTTLQRLAQAASYYMQTWVLCR